MGSRLYRERTFRFSSGTIVDVFRSSELPTAWRVRYYKRGLRCSGAAIYSDWVIGNRLDAFKNFRKVYLSYIKGLLATGTKSA